MHFGIGYARIRLYPAGVVTPFERSHIQMLGRLTRMQRVRAGWSAALIYLLCVLAPAVALALPGTPPAAPCLTGEHHMGRMVYGHDDATMRHESGHVHHQAMAHASSSDHGTHDHSAHATGDGDDQEQRTAAHGQGLCCGVMCVVALPADLGMMAMPALPTALRVFAGTNAVSDNAPARLYRPPIA